MNIYLCLGDNTADFLGIKQVPAPGDWIIHKKKGYKVKYSVYFSDGQGVYVIADHMSEFPLFVTPDGKLV